MADAPTARRGCPGRARRAIGARFFGRERAGFAVSASMARHPIPPHHPRIDIMAENGSGAPQPQGQDVPPLVVKGQYVKDLSFENPGAPGIFEQIGTQPNVEVNVNVEVNRQDNGDFEVTLAISINAKVQAKAIFIVELSYAGIFMLGPQIPQDQHAAVLLIECPRLLFPFARAIVSDVTREGGFPPMALQPIDFVALFQQQMAQQGQASLKA
jgi:preprotein translocase subunit SecB